MRIICLSSVRSLYNVFCVADIVLTDSQHLAAVAHVDSFLQTYHWLAVYHFEREEAVFHFIPKSHMVYHIADLGTWLNPQACMVL